MGLALSVCGQDGANEGGRPTFQRRGFGTNEHSFVRHEALRDRGALWRLVSGSGTPLLGQISEVIFALPISPSRG